MHKQKIGRTSTYRSIILFLVIATFLLLSLESANALEVKVVSEPLQSTLSEEEPVSLTLAVSDYKGECDLSFETDLLRDGINPFYVFPDLNIRGDKNFIVIDTPSQEEIKVQIFGRAHSANEVKDEKNIFGLKIVKYDLGPYRYFEIEPVNAEEEMEGEKMIGSPQMFMVKVNEVEEFNKKLEKIEWNKLGQLKRFTSDSFFEKGLVNEAHILADELAKIPEPKDIFITTLQCCICGAIILCFLSFVIGYRKGKKKGEKRNG